MAISKRVKRDIDLLGEGEPIWTRQSRETDISWEAFQLFRDMGTQRTFLSVATEVGRKEKRIYEWAKKYDWRLRAAAWDMHLDRLVIRAKEANVVAEMNTRHAAQGVALQRVAGRRLQQFEDRPDLLEAISPGDVAKLAKVGVEIERTALAGEGDDREGGDIVFNINVKELPSWAPKTLPIRIGDGTVVEQQDGKGNVTGGANGGTDDNT